MEEQNKLPQSIIGAVVGWALAIFSWFGTHLGPIAVVLSIIATIYSIRASKETIKLRKKQERAVDEGMKIPDTET